MPNIIMALVEEKSRVKQIVPRLDSIQRAEAERALRFADINMAANDLEGMNDSLEELKLFR